MPCQQDSLYAAERLMTRRGRTFADQDELQEYVDELRDTYRKWESDFPNVVRIECYVKTTDRRGSVGWFDESKAAGIIDMSPRHLNELIVCHEVSHVLAEARYGSRSHDPWFARTYLELVFSAMGSQAYTELSDAFNLRGVRHDIDF